MESLPSRRGDLQRSTTRWCYALPIFVTNSHGARTLSSTTRTHLGASTAFQDAD
ncbi:hypothetical protein [Ferrimicrobium sp.]|uniref:hypothetical protein n=1 Tax=Ferrimicrobium sp. TaxID=2926050 RepID=UPI00261D6925|nr:hypothetical protein [Ferrimicrobium sp.]